MDREKLIKTAQLIFYGLPIGNNAPSDAPIVGNQSLAQVVLNRCESCTKNKEEFSFLVDTIVKMIKDTKGKEVHKIKLDETNLAIVKAGLTDQHGFLIKKSKG